MNFRPRFEVAEILDFSRKCQSLCVQGCKERALEIQDTPCLVLVEVPELSAKRELCSSKDAPK